jgi:two-component system nitrogen regulation response regulator NtrX
MIDATAGATVLILDDEKNIRDTIKLMLEQEGINGLVAHDIYSAMRVLRETVVDALVLDICLGEIDGVAFFRKLQLEGYAPPTIFISGHATLSQAAEAVRLGAADFLEKPFSAEKITVTIKRCLEHAALQQRLNQLELHARDTDIIGDSVVMKRLIAEVLKVSRTSASVLIQGESGTGKELIASTIHRNSPREQQPFVKVNCSAIPENLVESELFGYERGAFSGAVIAKKGLFELAHRGTIFLDEMADLSHSAQSKILRVLQGGEVQKLGSERPIKVDVRVISATHKNLKQCVSDGLFREDLYYRLNVVPIRVPSLRERYEDIPMLIHFFMRSLCDKNGVKEKMIDDDVLAELRQYRWPGNVRELQNVVERMLIMSGDRITLDNVPDDILIPAEQDQKAGATLRSFRNHAEREHIVATLKRHNGNVTKAAVELGVGRTYLHRRLVSFGISKQEIF